MSENFLPDWLLRLFNTKYPKMSPVSAALGKLGSSVRKKPGQKPPHENMMGQLFWPVIFLLKITGHSPLSYYKLDQQNDTEIIDPKYIFHVESHDNFKKPSKKFTTVKMEYGLNFKSPFFIWTFFVAIFFPYNQISEILGYPHVHGSSWWENLMSIVKEMASKTGAEEGQGPFRAIFHSIELLEIIIPLSHLIELILSWKESKEFAKFLNNWLSYQNEFTSTFSSSIDPVGSRRFIRFRNILLIFYVIGPTILLIILATLLFVNQGSGVSFFWKLFVTTPFVLETAAATLLEDMKAVMSYEALANAFLQIRLGIRHSLQWEKLTSGKVRGWRRLVCHVREQSDLTGQYQKDHQLLLILMSMVETTTLAFVFLNANWLSTTSDSWQISCQCTAYMVLKVGRFYLKILAADKITRNEGWVAYELENIDTVDTDYFTQLEIKYLHGIIKQKPTVISFGNYVTLTKSLLLGIAAQVVTYLIVLMQFSQSKTF